MLKRFRRWREDRAIARLRLEHAWEAAARKWHVTGRYRGPARHRLRDTALRFLLRKQFVGGDGLELSDEMCLLVATMAAVPVVGLDLGWYRGWSAVVIYASAFVPPGEWEDEYGIVHRRHEPLSGEAWAQGPVILSWEDICASSAEDGYNVVIHEMAHKLDMLMDGPNGAPPLHRDMHPGAWRDAFSRAFAALEYACEEDRPLPIDPYALEDSGEFFAVTSECFFEAPERLAAAWPDVFDQLVAFYRQDPRDPLARPPR